MTLRTVLRRYRALPLLAIGAIFYFKRFTKDPVGMTQFPAGAQCLLDSLPLQHCDATFTYPPFFALTMTPFAPLSMPVRNLVWYLVTLAVMTLCFMCCDFLARRVFGEQDRSERELVWLRGLTFLFSLKFVLAVLENQSYDAVVVLFVCAGLAALVTGREIAGGVSLAIGGRAQGDAVAISSLSCVQAAPVAAAAMAVALVVASLLPDLLFAPSGSPFAYIVSWMREVGGPAMTEKLDGPIHVFWFAGNPNNSSLRGLTGLFVVDHLNTTVFRPVLLSIYAIYVTVVAALLWRNRKQENSLPIDGAILVISMLMLSPMTQPFALHRADIALRRAFGGMWDWRMNVRACWSNT